MLWPLIPKHEMAAKSWIKKKKKNIIVDFTLMCDIKLIVKVPDEQGI